MFLKILRELWISRNIDCSSYIHVSVHAYIHTCIRTYIHPYIHTYIHTYFFCSCVVASARPVRNLCHVPRGDLSENELCQQPLVEAGGQESLIVRSRCSANLNMTHGQNSLYGGLYRGCIGSLRTKLFPTWLITLRPGWEQHQPTPPTTL